MPLGYGSNFELPKLSLAEISTSTAKKSSLTGILRILLTIAEIGGGFFLGPLGELGLSLAAGIGNEILDVEEGSASATGAVLNFAAPFAGFAGAAKAGLRATGNIVKGAEQAINTFEEVGQALGGQVSKIGPLKNVGNLYGSGALEGLTKSNQLPFLTRIKGAKGVVGAINNVNDGLGDVLKGSIKGAGQLGSLGSGTLKIGDNIAREIDEEYNEFANTIGLTNSQRSRFLELLGATKWVNLGEKTYVDEALQLEAIEFLRKLDSSTNVRLARFQDELEAGLTAVQEFDRIPAGLRLNSEFSVLISTVQSLRKDGKMFSKEFIFKANLARSEALEKQTKNWKNQLKKLFMNPGSAKFNDWIVQPMQAIFDPNDLGRAPVEFIYRKLKKQLGDYFSGAKKIIDEAKDLEEAFRKTGGTLISSSWIMGYKVIPSMVHLPGTQQMVMISFRPGPSYNKKPVIVRATDRQLEKLVEDPGHTYHKYWALSKGGAKMTGLGIFKGAGVLDQLKLFNNSPIMAVLPTQAFSFFNINALRNVLSLVSNVVENTSAMAKGEYANTYFSKLTSSFTRNAVSRSFRLLAKGVAGPAATRVFGQKIGKFIGAEAQRIGTQVIVKGIRNVQAGKSFTKGLGRAAETSALVSIRSNLRSGLRAHNKNSAVLATLSWRRKAQQVKRIPNAVTPGRQWRGQLNANWMSKVKW